LLDDRVYATALLPIPQGMRVLRKSTRPRAEWPMRLVSDDQAADVEGIMVNVSSREARAGLVGVTSDFDAGQSTACNAIHSVEQRLARWLSWRKIEWDQISSRSRRNLWP
jgi:hypothetical protein